MVSQGSDKDLERQVWCTANHWQSLDALIDFAYGQENLLRLEQQGKNSNKAVISYVAVQNSSNKSFRKRSAERSAEQLAEPKKRYILTQDQKSKLSKCFQAHQCILCGRPTDGGDGHSVQNCTDLRGATLQSPEEAAKHKKHAKRHK